LIHNPNGDSEIISKLLQVYLLLLPIIAMNKTLAITAIALVAVVMGISVIAPAMAVYHNHLRTVLVNQQFQEQTPMIFSST